MYYPKKWNVLEMFFFNSYAQWKIYSPAPYENETLESFNLCRYKSPGEHVDKAILKTFLIGTIFFAGWMKLILLFFKLVFS